MEAMFGKNSQDQYFENIRLSFVKDKRNFYNTVYFRAVSQIASGLINTHIEVMDLSAQLLEKSRKKGMSHKTSKEYRDVSFELRKIAHKIFAKFGLTKDERFLKLIS